LTERILYDKITYGGNKMTDEEIQFSGIIGGFDRLKIKFYFVCFVIITIIIIFWLAIILLFLLVSGKIIYVALFSISPLLLAFFSILNKSPETFYKISKNKISVWVELNKFNKTYDKTDIKKIFINNEYTIIYTKDGILSNMYLIKKDFLIIIKNMMK
jgi:hypothetical protein